MKYSFVPFVDDNGFFIRQLLVKIQVYDPLITRTTNSRGTEISDKGKAYVLEILEHQIEVLEKQLKKAKDYRAKVLLDML